MINVNSVKDRLRNYAKQSGYNFQEVLTYYGLERTIYRISISDYADRFILKGGIFLYGIFEKNYERITTDIDLLARKISNSSEEMKEVFNEILSQDVDDALVYDLDSIEVTNITEFKKYHGLHVAAIAYLDKTKIPVSIDIGYGDVIYPDVIKMEFPVLLDMEAPVINAYSLETSIAEKLEAIIHNGYLNSRYKDFYDIYILSEKYEISFDSMMEAVNETFENRGTPISMNTDVFGLEFVNDTTHQIRWNSFVKKKRTMVNVSFEDAIARVKLFAEPLLNKDNSKSRWNPDKGNWE